MTLVAFTIPDDPTQLPAWLEQRLVAPDFGRFVAELSAAHPERGRSRVPARQLLGDWYRPALKSGLGTVPVGVLQQLLRNPKCLLELQEAVLTEGGAYWDDVADLAEELAPAVSRGKAALEAMFNSPRANPDRKVGGGFNDREAEGGFATRPSRPYRSWAMVSSALAACLLVAVGVLAFKGGRDGRPVETASIGWGWAKPDGIPQANQKPAEYLNGLATTAGEWFYKRPDDAAAVAKRINEFRTGCSQLIFSSHSALAQADKEWLVEKCRLWAKKLDDHLTALESGTDPLKVRDAADDTVHTLQKALRDQATKLG